MATVQIQRRCPQCQRTTVHDAPKTSHWLHLVLTLLTMGLWLFVWVPIAAVNSGRNARCVEH